MSSMVSLGVWATGQELLRATHPMEVVTISIQVIPVASSCMMWPVYIVATTGLTIASGCMGSRGFPRAVAGNRSLCRQAITSLKPGCQTTSCIGSGDPDGDVESQSAHLTCGCSSAHQHQALHSPELWLQCLHLDSLRAREACPVAVTGWEGCSTFLQPGTDLGKTLPLSTPHVVSGA